MSVHPTVSLALTTKIPEQHFTFKWKVHDASKTPGRLESPPFSVAPGYPKDWHFSIACVAKDTLQIALHYKSEAKRPVRVFQNFRACDSNGKVLESNAKRLFNGSGEDAKFDLCEIDLGAETPDDVLHLRCDMTVYGYDVTTDASLFDDVGPGGDVLDFRGDMRKLMEEEENADITVACRDHVFEVHECILRFRAPEFAKVHAKDMEKGLVKLCDVDYVAFKSFLEYVYTGDVSEMPDAIKLYVLASQYALRGLQRICAKWVMSSPDMRTVCEALDMADTYQDEEFLKQSKTFARAHLACLQKTSHWKALIQRKPRLEEEVKSFSFTGL